MLRYLTVPVLLVCVVSLLSAQEVSAPSAAVQAQAETLAAAVLQVKIQPLDRKYDEPELVQRIESGQYLRDLAQVVRQAARQYLKAPLPAPLLADAQQGLALSIAQNVPQSRTGEKLVVLQLQWALRALGAAPPTVEEQALLKQQAEAYAQALEGQLQQTLGPDWRGKAPSQLTTQLRSDLERLPLTLAAAARFRPLPADQFAVLVADETRKLREAGQSGVKPDPNGRLSGPLEMALRRAGSEFLTKTAHLPVPQSAEEMRTWKALAECYSQELRAAGDRWDRDNEAQFQAVALANMYANQAEALDTVSFLVASVLGGSGGGLVTAAPGVRAQHGLAELRLPGDPGSRDRVAPLEWYRSGARLVVTVGFDDGGPYDDALWRLQFRLVAGNGLALAQHLPDGKPEQVDLQPRGPLPPIDDQGVDSLTRILAAQLPHQLLLNDWLARLKRESPLPAATSEKCAFAPPLSAFPGHVVASADVSYAAGSLWPDRVTLRDPAGAEVAALTVTEWLPATASTLARLPRVVEWEISPGHLPMETSMGGPPDAAGQPTTELWSATVDRPARRIVETLEWLETGEPLVRESHLFDEQGQLLAKYSLVKYRPSEPVDGTLFR
ncbi:MAG TPA: hypothetical protein VGM19_09295 [Armatimonadota bacterium]|jgi:hypothetical protein